MPIFKFIAVTGTALLALLFAADAMLTPSGPLFTNDSEGLTRSEPKQQQAKRPEPVQTQEAPRTRAPSLLQVDSKRAEPARDETVRFELPQPVIAAPAQAPAQVPAPVATLVPAPAPAPLPAAIEATASAPETPVDPAASAAMAAETARTDAAPIKAAKVDPTVNEAAETETARPQAANATASKSAPTKPAATRTETAATAPITVQAPRAARAPKPRKPAARQPESRSRHVTYRDGQHARDRGPRTENGYAYGVSPAEARAERLDMQRRWNGDDFGPGHYRF